MPDAIKKVGIKKYLNSTTMLHNGLGYSDLVRLLNQKPATTKTGIADAFGVSRETIYDWIRRINEGQI